MFQNNGKCVEIHCHDAQGRGAEGICHRWCNCHYLYTEPFATNDVDIFLYRLKNKGYSC